MAKAVRFRVLGLGATDRGGLPGVSDHFPCSFKHPKWQRLRGLGFWALGLRTGEVCLVYLITFRLKIVCKA